jgi:flavin reductase (DIM6/NTAB) family NADH-FMN oxidoreductase RutF
MNATSATVGSDVDEFALSGLAPAPSRLVTPARVLESPVNFECRLSQLIQLQTAAGDGVETWLVLGEVVAIHIDRALLVDGVYDTAAARPILRAGRMGDYAEIRPDAMFEMQRPR